MQVTDEMVEAAWEAYDNAPGHFTNSELMRAALTAALAKAWRPIESAPRDTLRVSSETLILGHAEKKWIRFGKWYVQEKRWYYSGTNERSQYAQVRGDAPTHWMPLHEPPATKEGE